MATYAKVLLSGATYGSHEDIPLDASYKTVHQTSTTSGAVEDVTVVLHNDATLSHTFTVSIEQDGTVIKTFPVTVPAGESKNALSQVTLGENVDVKIKYSVDANPVFSSESLIFHDNTAGSMIICDKDGANRTVVALNSHVSNDPSSFAIDTINNVMFVFDDDLNTIFSYDLLTGNKLGAITNISASYLNTNLYASGYAKKLIVLNQGNNVAYYDYSTTYDHSSATGSVLVNGTYSVQYAGINRYGVIGISANSGVDNLLFWSWDDIGGTQTTTLTSLYSIYYSVQQGGGICGQPDGDGWCLFSNNASYATFYGKFGNGTNNATTWPSTYRASFAGLDDDYVYLVAGNSSYDHLKIAYGSTSATASITNSSSASIGPYEDYRHHTCPIITDGTNDCIFFPNGNGSIAKIAIDAFTYAELANDPVPSATPNGVLTGAAPPESAYFTGYANQQLP
jgi:hypothetical protein